MIGSKYGEMPNKLPRITHWTLYIPTIFYEPK